MNSNKLVRLSDVEKFLKENQFTIYTENNEEDFSAVRCDILLESLSSLPTQISQEIDNFYEFSEWWEVWEKWRLSRYTYRTEDWETLSARYFRNLPPTN